MKKILSLLLLATISPSILGAFFVDHSSLIEINSSRLSYGVAVTDFNNDGSLEFIVTGFGYPNLALSYIDDRIKSVILNPLFEDRDKKTIGVTACDIDGDGSEELYFLNTDRYSGQKAFGDRLLKYGTPINDLFDKPENKKSRNYTAGRSVACVDRKGNGRYGIYVSNYGGPSRFFELNKKGFLEDSAPKLGINNTTGGRAVVSGHILGNRNDIYASNERGPNFLLENIDGEFFDRAVEYGLDDSVQNGRGAALADILYDGRLGIIAGNWNGFHRIYVPFRQSFTDFATSEFKKPSPVRTIVSADFDNDGYDEVFVNNFGQPNRLFKLRDNGVLEQIKLSTALEASGLGTGAAVADIDQDGILELLIAHGEKSPARLTLYKADIPNAGRYIRVTPKTRHNAPARGSTVILKTNIRNHAKTIDAGSGYLCQMEPTAHFGLRINESVESIRIRWTDGTEEKLNSKMENTELVIRQK